MIDIEKEREAFEEAYSLAHKIYPSTLKKYADGSYYNGAVRAAWRWWQASALRAEAKLDGCVVVPKDQIEVWWQDAEEPENFATHFKDLHFIADGLEDGDIMKISEHHTVHLPSTTLYGAWIYKDGDRVFITGSKADVEAARGGNEKE